MRSPSAIPEGDDWAFEVKWDGYRTVVHVADGGVRLQSTAGHDVTARWPEFGDLATGVNAASAILDAELVVFDDDGHPSFELAQQSGVANLGFGNLVMFVVAGILIYLAITKEYEPLLLIPIGFGAVLANLPLAHMGSEGEGILAVIYDAGIRTELLPPLIFMGVGVLTDFRPLLGRPLTFLLGAAAQLGIFVAALGVAALRAGHR